MQRLIFGLLYLFLVSCQSSSKNDQPQRVVIESPQGTVKFYTYLDLLGLKLVINRLSTNPSSTGTFLCWIESTQFADVGTTASNPAVTSSNLSGSGITTDLAIQNLVEQMRGKKMTTNGREYTVPLDLQL